MVLVRYEVLVVVFLAAEKGYLSGVALVVKNRDVGDDLIDTFRCQLVGFLGLNLKDSPLFLGREDHRMPGKHIKLFFSLTTLNFIQVIFFTLIKMFQKSKNVLL